VTLQDSAAESAADFGGSSDGAAVDEKLDLHADVGHASWSFSAHMYTLIRILQYIPPDGDESVLYAQSDRRWLTEHKPRTNPDAKAAADKAPFGLDFQLVRLPTCNLCSQHMKRAFPWQIITAIVTQGRQGLLAIFLLFIQLVRSDRTWEQKYLYCESLKKAAVEVTLDATAKIAGSRTTGFAKLMREAARLRFFHLMDAFSMFSEEITKTILRPVRAALDCTCC
jgi:hypothetical protein